MCSNCSGDYENPEMTQEPEDDPLQVVLAEYSEQIQRTGRVMPEAPSRVPDLKALAAEQAEELVQGYSIMVRTGRREDWMHLLELAYMRGFNESTMRRVKAEA